MNGPARTVRWVAGLVLILTMPLAGCSDTSSPDEPQADPYTAESSTATESSIDGLGNIGERRHRAGF